MAKVQYTLLIKFLKLFIKEADLQEQDEKTLFDALKIIDKNKDIINEIDIDKVD